MDSGRAKAEKDRVRALKKRFGLTRQEYAVLNHAQLGLCAICNKPQTGRWKNLSVDHNHQTDEIRGLLCARCNLALGMFEDDRQILRAAIEYLANPPARKALKPKEEWLEP